MISFHCIFVHQTFIARFGKTINHVLQWQRLRSSLLVQSISLWNIITFDRMLWTKRFVSTTYIARVKKRISLPNQWRTNSFQSYVIFYVVGNVSLRGSCTFVHLTRYCCGTRECENIRYSNLQNLSVCTNVDVLKWCGWMFSRCFVVVNFVSYVGGWPTFSQRGTHDRYHHIYKVTAMMVEPRRRGFLDGCT